MLKTEFAKIFMLKNINGPKFLSLYQTKLIFSTVKLDNNKYNVYFYYNQDFL